MKIKLLVPAIALTLLTANTALACGWFVPCNDENNDRGWGRNRGRERGWGNNTTEAVVTADMQLANAIHNYDNLSLDDRLKLVTSLISDTKAKVNVNALNELEEPILGDAVHFGDGKSDDIRVVKALVEAGADVNAVSAKTHRSPLTKAAEFGKIEVIQYFFQHGLEINNENGTRALVKAAFMGHKSIVELFLDHGFRATGPYADALTADGMKSEETKATAVLFGAYVDIAKDELFGLIHQLDSVPRDQIIKGHLDRIFGFCKEMHKADAINGNMWDFFNRSEECSDMGRLGALAYMHCYGLIRGNSANLGFLQNMISSAAAEARKPLKFEKVKFNQIEEPEELVGYDNDIKKALAIYNDLLLPRLKLVAQRMAHHQRRNRQLTEQAETCHNETLYRGAKGISGPIEAVVADQQAQLQGFQAEMQRMEKMRSMIAFQLPALNATKVLKKREEEEARKKAEEERKKAEEEAQKKRNGRRGNGWGWR